MTKVLFMLCFAFMANAEVQTVDSVDLNAYQGDWYEILRIPQSFQEGCFDTRANYSIRRDGNIDVVNSCIKMRNGKIDQSVGRARARVVDRQSNAKLEVSFVPIPGLRWLFAGDYWILALGEKNNEGLYSWAFVGNGDRSTGWILSRTSELSEEQMQAATDAILSKGYDLNRFINEEELRP